MDLNSNVNQIDTPIAIVGIGCRFPGGVNSADSFWTLLTNEVDAISEIPPDRMDIGSLYDPRPAIPGKIMTRWGGFLENIDQFDASFFGISPREADRLDPQQRLLLEVAWEALEDAGEIVTPAKMLHGGVFVGCWLNEYESRLFGDPDQIDFYMTTGSGRYSASGRLSYFLGMQGPAITVDTACSSSLVAVHLACQSLRSNECSLALAGGVNVILQPNISIAYSQSRMMAPDGRCKFGDERGNGYVRSEGAALVALKRLPDALADGNPIYAIILGSAVNNDGRSSGTLTTPGTGGQEDLLRKAYRNARVSPGQVQYVEAHGTGTRAGDPVEIQALGTVLSEGRPAGSFCSVGSVKTNLGHTEGAAGVAGLIKVALSLKHRYIPASLHFKQPNPNIPWAELPVRIQDQGGPWPAHSGPAIAGVSAFGIAGTNAHVVLQEAPTRVERNRPLDAEAANRSYLLPLSARSPAALLERVAQFRQMAGASPSPSLHDLCYTAGARRTHLDYRAAFVARSLAELEEQLSAYAGEWQPESVAPVEPGERKILFVFPGQGSQWVGMGRKLMEKEPVFRRALERCSQAIQPLTGWSLVEWLGSAEAAERMEQIDYIQPALFAIQLALAEQWRAWGIEPTAVAGHSMGEVAAACFAGALRLEDAARVICHRSRLMKTVSGKGAMYLVDLAYDDARSALAGYEDRISIAVSNSPRSTVLSGDPAALEEVVAGLKSREVLCRQVKVDVAAHSPIMDSLRPLLEQSLGGLQAQPSTVPVYSTVTGQVEPGEAFDVAYWGRNLRQPVLFSAVIQRALQDGIDTVIEMSPHPVLLAAVEQTAKFFSPEMGARVATLPSARRDEDEQMILLQSLGKLFTLGHPIDWNRLYPQGGKCITLPHYPWQRERFWMETKRPDGPAQAARVGAHPLSGLPVEIAGSPSTLVREIRLTKAIYPELYAHRLYGATLLPASAYLELVWAVAEELPGKGPLELSNVEFERAMLLPEDQAVTVQVALTPAEHDHYRFHIHSRADAGWLRHASGRIRRISVGEWDGRANAVLPSAATRQGSSRSLSAQSFYRWLSERGIQFDLPLHAFETVWSGDGEALGQLRPDAGSRLLRLDPLFQITAAALPGSESTAANGVYLPATIDTARIDLPAAEGSEIYARTLAFDTGAQIRQDILQTGPDGRVIVEMSGVRLQALGQAALQDTGQWLYDLEWQPVERRVAPDGGAGTPRLPADWLILSDRGGVGQAVSSMLEQRGDTCTLVFPGAEEQLDQWIGRRVASAQPGPLGILHLMSLDLPAAPPRCLDELETGIEAVCLSALRTVQRVAEAGWRQAPRVWFVTRGAHPVGTGDRLPALAQAPLWGLGRVIAEEHPDLWGGLIDLDPELSPGQAAGFLVEEINDPQEPQLAYYEKRRLALRLVRHNRQASRGETIRWRPDASYVITGGLGGIGVEVARWMVQQGARRLIVMNRTPLPPREAWAKTDPESVEGRRIAAVRSLEALGASVHVAAVDVADPEQVSRWLEQYRLEGWPPVRGVVHAAGVTRDQLVAQMGTEDWTAVLRPKVRGGWLLHSALTELDFFITFSSIGAVLGLTGQGSYAAANAFLDALAQYRRASGLPALSINWGVWAGTGMSTSSGGEATLQALETQGMAAIRPELYLSALAYLMPQQSDEMGAPQTVVLPVDWERVKQSRLSPTRRQFVSVLTASTQSIVKEPAQAGIRETLAALEPEKRQRELESYLQKQIAQVLKLPPARIAPSKPLGSFGLDSLMGIELRGRLEAALDITLSATFVWNYPTLSQMTSHIADKLGISLTAAGPVQPPAPAGLAEPADQADQSIDDLLAQIAALPDETIQQTLRNNSTGEAQRE